MSSDMTLDSSGVAALRRRAQQELDEGRLPSCQFALARGGEVLVNETLGASPDARFIMFSATKGVFASLVWQLMGEGLLDVDAPVADVWPEFAANGKDAVTLDHVLLHTAGFPYAELDVASCGDRAARVAQMIDWKLAWTPGSHYEYHPLSAHWVLAELVARVTGQDHREALRERILRPLGLERLELGVPLERQYDVLPLVQTGAPPTAEELLATLGVDTFELPTAPGVSMTMFTDPQVLAAGVPGAGGASNAADLALFYQAVLDDRLGLWRADVLQDATSVVRNDLPHPYYGSATRTRGLEMAGEGPMAMMRIGNGASSSRTFGHSGAHGQIAWADPESGLSFVFLTNGGDQHFLREAERGRELNHLAVACLRAAA